MNLIAQLAVSVLLAAAAQAQPAESNDPAANKELKEQLAAIITKQNAVIDEHNAIIRAIKKREELVKLDEAIAAVQKELAAAEADNADLTAARDAEQQVRDAVKLAIEEKLREHPEGGKLLEQVTSLNAKRIEQQWQVQLARFQLEHPLSPVSRALAGDEALAKFKRMIKESQSQEETAVAEAAYDALLAKKIAETEEGQRLQAMIEDASAAALRLQESAVAIEQRLLPIRRAIEKEEAGRIAEARKDVESALNSDRIKELRQQVNDSIAAYNARVKELIAANEDATRLRKEYDELGAQIKKLKDKLLAEQQ